MRKTPHDRAIERVRAEERDCRDAEERARLGLIMDPERLRAAAPDLLTALLGLLDQPTMDPLKMTALQRTQLWLAHHEARLAILKAMGPGVWAK